jgi:hypothetical protein
VRPHTRPASKGVFVVDVAGGQRCRAREARSLSRLVAAFVSVAETTVLPSGVTAATNGPEPTGMSSVFFALVFTSIVDTVPRSPLGTKPVLPSGCHHIRGSADLDVDGILGPGLHIDRRHGAAALVGDEGGRPAPRTYWRGRHPRREPQARPPTRAEQRHEPTGTAASLPPASLSTSVTGDTA